MFFQAPTLHGDKTKLSYAYKIHDFEPNDHFGEKH